MKLFQPIKVGSLELKNRIVMSAMHLGYCTDGVIDERIINFYRARAEGGAGLLMVGGAVIDEHKTYAGALDISEDRFIPGHKSLTKAIQEAGARIGLQLFQAGRYTSSKISGIQAIAPSPIASAITREVPREMSREDINQVVEAFANAARRSVEAGYDLVEVIASAGYLISQFFSPLTNQRADEFGGSLENRARFGVEVVKAVREAVGSNFPIIVRLSGSEFMSGGNTNQEIQVFAQRLELAGADGFNVTGGWHESKVPQITMNVPPGAFVYLAQGIKQAVTVPVVSCNRINDPLLAEEILVQGRADLIGMARGLIADPELPNKAQSGRFGEIRKCVGCNQGCLDYIFSGRSCTCLVNARAGREGEVPLIRADKPKKVLVIGGGAAGMEAARVAALRGHQVTLWEQASKLGGQLLLAGAVPERSGLLNFVSYLANSLAALYVHIELNKTASLADIKEFCADAVIVATGAKPILPSIPGVDASHVVEAGAVIAGKAEVGQKVVVIGGGAVGCEVGMFISNQGTIDGETVKFLLLNNAETPEQIIKLATQGNKSVEIIEMEKAAGKGLGISTRWGMLQALAQRGVKMRTQTTALRIEQDGLVVAGPDGVEEHLQADTIVLAAGSRGENTLFAELQGELQRESQGELQRESQGEFSEVYLAGDAVKVRTALEAVREGFNIGVSI